MRVGVSVPLSILTLSDIRQNSLIPILDPFCRLVHAWLLAFCDVTASSPSTAAPPTSFEMHCARFQSLIRRCVAPLEMAATTEKFSLLYIINTVLTLCFLVICSLRYVEYNLSYRSCLSASCAQFVKKAFTVRQIWIDIQNVFMISDQKEMQTNAEQAVTEYCRVVNIWNTLHVLCMKSWIIKRF